jgi:hypothetical protein
MNWTFDERTGIHTGWLHPEGPQHVYLDSLGDRFVVTRDRSGASGDYRYNVQLVRFRAAGARLGDFDSLAAAKAAAEDHAVTNQERAS